MPERALLGLLVPIVMRRSEVGAKNWLLIVGLYDEVRSAENELCLAYTLPNTCSVILCKT